MAHRRLFLVQSSAAPDVKVPVEKDDCSAAIHDLAALSEGNLSPEGMERLAAHLPQCATCTETLFAIVEDMQPGRGGENSGLVAWLARVVGAHEAGKIKDRADATPGAPAGQTQTGPRRQRS